MDAGPMDVTDVIRQLNAVEPGAAWPPRSEWDLDVRLGNGSSPVSPDGQLCGLFAVDIAGFNGCRRDDDIQTYVHKSLYEILQAAFDKSDVPWFSCAHEDRGDGVLVILPPMIPVAGLVDPFPIRLRGLVRRHNRVSCEAAAIQLRVAVHVGPVHYDGHGFVGRDLNLLYRLLDARSLKRMLVQSEAEVAFITSGYMYENVILRRPSLVDPRILQPLSVRAKETRTRAWAYLLGALPLGRDLVQEAERGRGRGAAPGQQDLVEAVRFGARGLNGPRDRLEGRALASEQVGGIAAGPVQQGELDQQMGPDVADVVHRRAQPALGFLAARPGGGVDGALGAEAWLDRLGRDEPRFDEAADRPVDDGSGNAPDPAELAVGRGELRDGEAVGGPLAEQHENRPLRQRHRHVHELRG
jgi:hypothetical protein